MAFSKPSQGSPPLRFPVHALRSTHAIISSFLVSKLE